MFEAAALEPWDKKINVAVGDKLQSLTHSCFTMEKPIN